MEQPLLRWVVAMAGGGNTTNRERTLTIVLPPDRAHLPLMAVLTRFIIRAGASDLAAELCRLRLLALLAPPSSNASKSDEGPKYLVRWTLRGAARGKEDELQIMVEGDVLPDESK